MEREEELCPACDGEGGWHEAEADGRFVECGTCMGSGMVPPEYADDYRDEQDGYRR